MTKQRQSSDYTKKNYLILLKDLELDKNGGVWSLETSYTLGELASRLGILAPHLSSRWVVSFREVPQISSKHMTKAYTVIKVCKGITDTIKANTNNCTSLIIPANRWSKDEEHRRTLEA
jgi:hypothetical protein